MKRFKLGDMIEHCFLPDITFLVVGFAAGCAYRVLCIKGADDGLTGYLSIVLGHIDYNKVGNIFEKKEGGGNG